MLFISNIDLHASLSTIQWGEEHVTSPCDAKDMVASQGIIPLPHLLGLFHRTSTIIQSSIIQSFEDWQIHGYFWNRDASDNRQLLRFPLSIDNCFCRKRLYLIKIKTSLSVFIFTNRVFGNLADLILVGMPNHNHVSDLRIKD